MTKPLAPTILRLGSKDKPLQICWNRSMTSSVVGYKVRWKPIQGQTEQGEEIKAEEAHVPMDNTTIGGEVSTIYYCFPLGQVTVGMAYKVNVYAEAECGGHTAESKELHEKFVIKSPTEIALYVEEQQQS